MPQQMHQSANNQHCKVILGPTPHFSRLEQFYGIMWRNSSRIMNPILCFFGEDSVDPLAFCIALCRDFFRNLYGIDRRGCSPHLSRVWRSLIGTDWNVSWYLLSQNCGFMRTFELVQLTWTNIYLCHLHPHDTQRWIERVGFRCVREVWQSSGWDSYLEYWCRHGTLRNWLGWDLLFWNAGERSSWHDELSFYCSWSDAKKLGQYFRT